ncbi:MAG: PQQ-like beta-propeller repeat protein [Planctomycetes bacterium]|nr:PQQ-like beta-propeller repeat protein [Planctomycetota bacterium]MBI3835790.1 PQQ-like beta-propeller repeat protein [Planctomycetota bacterium]
MHRGMKNGIGVGSCGLACLTAVALTAPSAHAQWPQWGGRDRNFAVESGKLSTAWSTEGPKKIWSHAFGPGYSSIVVDGGKLYAMYRAADDEVVAALDAESGKTLWEHKYAAPLPEGMDPQFGKGPNSTPAVSGDRIYAAGVTGVLSCLDKNTGKIVWTTDLEKDQGVKGPHFGYSASPLVYKDSVIVSGGGAGHGMLAFDAATGKLRWAKQDFEDVYSSPILISVEGDDQIVLLAEAKVVGVSPKDGELVWSQPHENQWKTNISTPIWGSDGILYVTSGGEAGSRGLKLKKKADKTEVEEVWATRKMAVGQGNTVRVGDMVYGSSGGDGPMFITAINAKTGALAWRERGFGKAMMLHGDGKLLILDEDGNLAIAEPTAESLKVISKSQVLKKPAWTAPTLVGTRLYVRDNEQIMALDLGMGSG